MENGLPTRGQVWRMKELSRAKIIVTAVDQVSPTLGKSVVFHEYKNAWSPEWRRDLVSFLEDYEDTGEREDI